MAVQIPDFKIFNMNPGYHQHANAEVRKGKIEEILLSERPILAFIQEFEWTGLDGPAFKNYNIPDNYVFFSDKNTERKPGFIYDDSVIGVQTLDHDAIRSSYDSDKRGFKTDKDKLGREPRMESYFFDLDRLSLCKIKSKYPPEFELLCASWHGHHMGNGKGIKLDINERKVITGTLLRFLMEMKRKCGNLPLLIGGDFNLASIEVDAERNEISPMYLLSSPNQSIMSWIISDDFSKTFKRLNEDSAKYQAFDHLVLKTNLQLSSTASEYKRLVTWCGYGGTNAVEDKTGDYEYRLDIKTPTVQMISATWHGADADYSDEAKEESIRETIRFLVDRINRQHEMTQITGELDLKWALKDAPKQRNILTHNNILDTWILSNNKPSLFQIKRDGQRLEKIERNLLPASSNQSPNQQTNVEIHFDIVNVKLPYPDGYTLTGFFKRKIWISVGEQEDLPEALSKLDLSEK